MFWHFLFSLELRPGNTEREEFKLWNLPFFFPSYKGKGDLSRGPLINPRREGDFDKTTKRKQRRFSPPYSPAFLLLLWEKEEEEEEEEEEKGTR